jgi:hypothetical protein
MSDDTPYGEAIMNAVGAEAQAVLSKAPIGMRDRT